MTAFDHQAACCLPHCTLSVAQQRSLLSSIRVRTAIKVGCLCRLAGESYAERGATIEELKLQLSAAHAKIRQLTETENLSQEVEESKNVSGVLERAAAAIMHDILLEVVQTGCDVAPSSVQVDGQASRPEEFEARWGVATG